LAHEKRTDEKSRSGKETTAEGVGMCLGGPGREALKDVNSGLESVGQRDKGEPYQERE